jgi:hypothetical protein
LYDGNEFQRSDEPKTDKLFITINNLFPMKKYMTVGNTCLPISGVNNTHNTKIIERCQDRCNSDESCAGYSYRPFSDLVTKNCALYNRDALVDGISVNSTLCTLDQTETIRIAYVAETFSIAGGRIFEEVDVVSNDLLQDECKSLCYADAHCVS